MLVFYFFRTSDMVDMTLSSVWSNEKRGASRRCHKTNQWRCWESLSCTGLHHHSHVWRTPLLKTEPRDKRGCVIEKAALLLWHLMPPHKLQESRSLHVQYTGKRRGWWRNWDPTPSSQMEDKLSKINQTNSPWFALFKAASLTGLICQRNCFMLIVIVFYCTLTPRCTKEH